VFAVQLTNCRSGSGFCPVFDETAPLTVARGMITHDVKLCESKHSTQHNTV
jgi:hypothetical protein